MYIMFAFLFTCSSLCVRTAMALENCHGPRNISVIGDSEVYRLTGVSWMQAEQMTDMEVRMTQWQTIFIVDTNRCLWLDWGKDGLFYEDTFEDRSDVCLSIAVSNQSRKILLHFFPYLCIFVPTCRTLAPPVMYWAERCVVSALLRPTFDLLKSRCGFSLSLALSVDNDFIWF